MNKLSGKEANMIVVDGQFLLGVAAVLTSLATLWRAVRKPDDASRRNPEKN